jgi:O-antigen ligase
MATRRAASAADGERLRPRSIAAESTERSAAEPLTSGVAGPLLGISLNGFFLYLGALRLVDVAPRTPITGVYYGLLGFAIAVVVWDHRARLVSRVRAGAVTAAVFGAASATLAVWFLASAAFLSDGTSASRLLAAQLVFWTIPTALLALSLSRRQLEGALFTIAALGLLFVAIDAVALVADAGALGDRFSPIPKLDPIRAALIPALGALAVLSVRPRNRALEHARPAAIFLLTAFAVVPGSRGPLAALAVGGAVAIALAWRSTGPRVLVALALGAALGAVLAATTGTSRHLTSELEGSPRAGEQAPISSLKIRERLIRKALRAAVERPLAGNGVGTLVDDTPEAYRMGIAGRRTYPHNTFVEALYSLGVPGLVLFVAALAAAVAALVRLARRARDALAVFAVAFFAFAFVNSNLTGEIGADAPLWTASALAIGLLAAFRLSGGRAERT